MDRRSRSSRAAICVSSMVLSSRPTQPRSSALLFLTPTSTGARTIDRACLTILPVSPISTQMEFAGQTASNSVSLPSLSVRAMSTEPRCVTSTVTPLSSPHPRMIDSSALFSEPETIRSDVGGPERGWRKQTNAATSTPTAANGTSLFIVASTFREYF